MKKLFTLGLSYDITTYNSANDGEVAEHGWDQEPEQSSLRECLEAINRMGGIDYHDGISFYPCNAEIDYETGEHRRTFVHVQPLSKSAWKAWDKALRIAGI
jgi:hypothetical protein